jgi:hypothetical protein
VFIGMQFHAHFFVFISHILEKTWNTGSGVRIFFQQPYPHGDDARALHAGNSVFTRDTADDMTGVFRHHYVRPDFSICCGSFNQTTNGDASHVPVYVRPY